MASSSRNTVKKRSVEESSLFDQQESSKKLCPDICEKTQEDNDNFHLNSEQAHEILPLQQEHLFEKSCFDLRDCLTNITDPDSKCEDKNYKSTNPSVILCSSTEKALHPSETELKKLDTSEDVAITDAVVSGCSEKFHSDLKNKELSGKVDESNEIDTIEADLDATKADLDAVEVDLDTVETDLDTIKVHLDDDDDEEEEEIEEASSLPTEVDVGITEYISHDLPGFPAIFKLLYSDFLVNEIDIEGNVIRLTDMSEPEEEEEEEEKLELDMLSDDEKQKLKDIAGGVVKDSLSINVTSMDKDSRKKIHEAIRQHFHGLESTTKGTESEKIIEVTKSKGKTRQKQRGSNYIHFVVYKENTDTMDAVNRIASMLRFAPKILSYAGTKDRRAKTVQAFSAFRVEPKKLLSINRRDYKIKVGNITFKDKDVRLGDLSGNFFTIILRKVEADDDLINKAMTSLLTKGFINYFGMQRFGTTVIPTHAVGKELLCGKYKEAVDLILYPRYHDDDEGKAEALQIWAETGDAKAALEVMYFKNGIEGSLLKGLATHKKNDYVSALNNIPRNIRLMYIHAYQSYIWNKVASRRIKKYHMQVLPGDIIMTGDSGLANKNGFQKFSTMEPKFITSEEIDKPDLIYDLVLPLPGHSVVLPKNEIKDWYDEFLKEDGMSLSSFKTKVKDFSLSGAYRKMLVRPRDLKWEVIPYSDSLSPLVLSDYDILQGRALPPRDPVGEFKAIKMEFSLSPSTYATMALREVLKIDTSISTQMKLNSQSLDT